MFICILPRRAESREQTVESGDQLRIGGDPFLNRLAGSNHFQEYAETGCWHRDEISNPK